MHKYDKHIILSFLKILIPFSLILLYITTYASPSLCWDRPFNNAANWGGTGLLEIPTARVLDDGEFRAGLAQTLPYRWYYTSMGVFPGIELGFRMTQLTNIKAKTGLDYGDYKDKAFDLKYQIFPESKKFPALAFGLHDFDGTKLFSSEYIAFSRQIFPFDFTIGLGSKRLCGPVHFSLWDDVGVFGGIELALHKKIHLTAEYNPIEYEKDKGAAGKAARRAMPGGAKLPLNFGLRVKLISGIDMGLSYERGDTLGFMFNIHAPLGQEVLPKRPDPPLQHSIDRKPLHERDIKKMLVKILDAVRDAGFRDGAVYIIDRELTAQFTNEKYLSDAKAAGRVLRILLFHSPEEIKKLNVIMKRRGLSLLRVSVKPDHLEKYLFGGIDEDVFNRLIEIDTSDTITDQENADLGKREEKKGCDVHFGIKPDFEMYLNDPSGFFKCRPGIKPYMVASPWIGASAFARYDIPFYSNIRSSNIPPDDAVRSDSWKYAGLNYAFDRIQFDQTLPLFSKTFVRLSGGYLERMYAGLGGEMLTFPGGGNLAIGIEADWVKKRRPGCHFDLLDLESYTTLGNIYYGVPRWDLTFHAQYGRFLAGDMGWMFEINRRYETGATLGFWYSVTDMDRFSGYNRDYHEKGVRLSIPIQMFLSHTTTRRFNYSISPWTRDVAASVYHWQDLFHLFSDLMPDRFKKKITDIKK